jgi:hypothetical protein
VEFLSTSYIGEGASPFGRTHDVAQYFARFTDTGFTSEGIMGTHGSAALPEYPCSDESTLCWISTLPALIAVYPKYCLPECGAWQAFGFQFQQRNPYHLIIDGKPQRVILYEVTSPAGKVQIHLVSSGLGVVGFTDFYGEPRNGPKPVLLRTKLDSGQVFPFEPAPAARRDFNDEDFLEYFGIKWSDAQKRGRITRPTQPSPH